MKVLTHYLKAESLKYFLLVQGAFHVNSDTRQHLPVVLLLLQFF